MVSLSDICSNEKESETGALCPWLNFINERNSLTGS
jgi:hypothetical protein